MFLALLLSALTALPASAAPKTLGSGPFSSRCDSKRPKSDNCLSCHHMHEDRALEAAWRKPRVSASCRMSHIAFRRNSRGNYDVIGRRRDSGREEIVRFDVVLQEVTGSYRSDPALAQKDMEDEESELHERAQYAKWAGKVKVVKVMQNFKPVSPTDLREVADITLSYELRDLSADRIFSALDRINYVNANSPIGKLVKPLVDWAIGESGVAVRRVNSCMLRKAKNQFASLHNSPAGLGTRSWREVRFFCLDSKKEACGDCFRNRNNNLKDLAYQIVLPENGTLRAIQNSLQFMGETLLIEWDDPIWGENAED